ncbi:uncharacterized protein LOC112468166 [Temnothorax curvispinosus]|uniref:Uncharacterized protein LOC112468166 n=1 Tax=Temnothorax curvispinosus TaxID=300111 RepID=A0A6J1RJW5_9HYME|nr:uncharacterized protein LOC112468166 [Temnothorax curvispinosus]
MPSVCFATQTRAKLVFVCVIRPAWDLDVGFDVRKKKCTKELKHSGALLYFARHKTSTSNHINRTKIVSRVILPELPNRLLQQVVMSCKRAKRMEVSARFLKRAVRNETRELEMQFD